MKKICIVLSTYNSEITNKLYDSARNELLKSAFKEPDLIKVSGSFEIPVAISRLIKKYDGFIAIGCIIKGETANFDLISSAITNGIMQISTSEKKPIGNAVLTCFNKNQAKNRFDRGSEAAKAVITVLKNVPSK
mgnify:CR=1 FL=1|tara:strand:+ start:129 stop:530 length:402 start_codon:yes stop_codon:yes gene_type:complete